MDVDLSDADLEALLTLVEAGEEVVIRRGSRAIARLVPAGGQRVVRLGYDEGRFAVPDDFDAPLPDSVVEGLG